MGGDLEQSLTDSDTRELIVIQDDRLLAEFPASCHLEGSWQLATVHLLLSQALAQLEP